MTSKLHARFRRDFGGLPTDIQRRARVAYRRFAADPTHPGLEFKALTTRQPLWSVRVNDDYRAVGVRDGDTIVWFFIGTHAEYGRLLSRS